MNIAENVPDVDPKHTATKSSARNGDPAGQVLFFDEPSPVNCLDSCTLLNTWWFANKR